MSTTKQKSLFDIAIERKYTTLGQLVEFVKGKKVKTISSTRNQNSGHNCPKKLTFDFIAGVNIASFNTLSLGSSTSLALRRMDNPATTYAAIYLHELALDVCTKEELVADLANITTRYETEVADLKEKIDLLTELGLEEYDEQLIKVVRVMGNFEPKKGSKFSKLDLAKQLTEAFK